MFADEGLRDHYIDHYEEDWPEYRRNNKGRIAPVRKFAKQVYVDMDDWDIDFDEVFEFTLMEGLVP